MATPEEKSKAATRLVLAGAFIVGYAGLLIAAFVNDPKVGIVLMAIAVAVALWSYRRSLFREARRRRAGRGPGGA